MKEHEAKRLWVVSLLLFLFGFISNLILGFNVSETQCVAIGASCQDTLVFGFCAVWFFGILSLPFTAYYDFKDRDMLGWLIASVIAIVIVFVSFYIFITSVALCTGLDNKGYVKAGNNDYPIICHEHLTESEDEKLYTYYYRTGLFTYTYCFTADNTECFTYEDEGLLFKGDEDVLVEYSRFY